ncbi:transposase [Rhizobium oryzihabitans]|uniref:transposase n=1 Tax=Rhizobium oryzihabitans TaxID=2267833 RepID=UPI004036B70D
MARFDLTAFEWDVIQPLLPSKVRGVKRVDDRRASSGGCGRGMPWADISARYDPYTTAWEEHTDITVKDVP